MRLHFLKNYYLWRLRRMFHEHPAAGCQKILICLCGDGVEEWKLWGLVPRFTQWKHAEDLWRDGEISQAITCASAAQRKRFIDEYQVLRDPLASFGNETTRIRRENSVGGSKCFYLVNNALPYVRSGYTHRTHALIKELTELGEPVEVVCRPPFPFNILGTRPKNSWIHDGVNYKAAPFLSTGFHRSDVINAAVEAVVREFEAIGAGMIHATTDWQNGIVGLRAARQLGVPFVYEMRGELENTWVSRYRKIEQPKIESSERYQLLRKMETMLADEADAVICLSHTQEESMIDRGIDPAKIVVVPNGVHCDGSEVAPFDLDADIVFGTVSAIVSYEGLELLVDVLAQLREDGHKAHLVIAGKGAALKKLQTRADELNVSQWCSFPGYVEGETCQRWYETIDVFCVPRRSTKVSRFVTPLKSFPALARGKTVLVSDLPALVEITPPECRARWVVPNRTVPEWAEAIVRESEASEKSAIARAFASGRTWRSSAMKIAELHHRLANRM